MRTVCLVSVVLALFMATAVAHAGRAVTDDELGLIRGAGWTCQSSPCAQYSCGWNEARGVCVYVDFHPDAICVQPGGSPVCCSDEEQDCTREGTSPKMGPPPRAVPLFELPGPVEMGRVVGPATRPLPLQRLPVRPAAGRLG